MKKLARLLAVALVLLTLLSGSALAAEPWLKDFEVRGGVQFGMHWQEVVDIETASGFQPKGSVPYTAGNEYQINYHTNIRVGKVDCYRLEYDFHTSDGRLFQFYYVATDNGRSDYDYFSNALNGIYGAPTYTSQDSTTLPPLQTDKFKDTSTFTKWSEWVVEYEDGYMVIDLWYNSYDTLFCCYNYVSTEEYAQRTPSTIFMTEDESINFGL